MDGDPVLVESAASASATFDAYAWVEEALALHSENPSSLASLVPQLSLRSQTLAQTLHVSLQHVSLSLPPLQTRLHELQQSTTPLSQRLITVQEACVPSSSASNNELPHLVTLHEAKQRLQSCSQALVEAAKWGRNVRECFAALEDPALLSQGFKGDTTRHESHLGNANGLTERVREMQTSLEVLKDLPGARERKQTMERLCAQIEAAVQPRLASKLGKEELEDVILLRWYRDILATVNRDHLVKEEFCRARPAHVHRVWYSYTDVDTIQLDEDDKQMEFSIWLDSFYDEVVRMLHRESFNAYELFHANQLVEVLLELLHHTFEPLTKSFRDRLASSNSEFQLEYLVRCFQASKRFAGQVIQRLRSLETEFKVNFTSGVAKLVQDFFEPYRLYFTEYTRFGSEALTDALLRLVPPFHSESTEEDVNAPLDEFSQRLEEASEALCTIVDQSLQYCYEFTTGAAFPQAIEAVGAAVQQFTLTLSAAMPAIRKHCNAETLSDVENRVNGSVVASPDWSHFHVSLALLKACGTLESQLCATDARLRIRMREQLSHLLGKFSEASSPRRRKKSTSCSLVDLLDPIKLVAAVSQTWLQSEDSSRQSQLHHLEVLLNQSGFNPAVSRYPRATLLDEAQRAVQLWTKEAQLLTYDTVFLPISRVLATIPSNKSWCKVPDASLGALPAFSMLPQDYITMVADLLLSLLPQLEPFAQSSSLESAFIASRDALEVCVQSEWTRFGQVLNLTHPELAICQRIFGSDDSNSSDLTATATEFVDLWTAAVASGTLAALLRRVCSISVLSEMGTQQLAADLSYFHNVLSAVGGDANFIVNDLCKVLQSDIQGHTQYIQELRNDSECLENQVLAKLNARVLTMRQQGN